MNNSGSFCNQCHLKWFPYLVIIAMRVGHPRPINELDTVILILSELSYMYWTKSYSLKGFVERGNSLLWSPLGVSFVTLLRTAKALPEKDSCHWINSCLLSFGPDGFYIHFSYRGVNSKWILHHSHVAGVLGVEQI